MRQPGRDRGRGGGGRAEEGGRAPGLRTVFVCEMVCMFTTPSDSEGVCFGGLGMSWENQ